MNVAVSETFWTNPQYHVTIEEPDDDNEDGNGAIIVGLMQKHRRKMRSEGKDNETIGYAIYEVMEAYDEYNNKALRLRILQMF